MTDPSFRSRRAGRPQAPPARSAPRGPERTPAQSPPSPSLGDGFGPALPERKPAEQTPRPALPAAGLGPALSPAGDRPPRLDELDDGPARPRIDGVGRLGAGPQLRVRTPGVLRPHNLRAMISGLGPRLSRWAHAYRAWLARLSPRKTMAALAATALAAMMVLGLAINVVTSTATLVFGGGPSTPPARTISGDGPRPQAAGPVAGRVDAVRNRLLAVRAMKISQRSPKLELLYNGMNRTVIVTLPGRTSSAVADDGELLTYEDFCWAPAGRGQAPDPRKLTLALADRRVKFTSAQGDTLRFSASALGELGAGSGQLTVRRDLPVELRYRERAGKLTVLTFTYPDPGKLPTGPEALQPRCSEFGESAGDGHSH